MSRDCFPTKNCFNCIREGTEYDFVYECSNECLEGLYNDKNFRSKDDLEYLLSLIQNCITEIDTELAIFVERGNIKLHRHRLIVLGDSLARLYLFELQRNRLVTINTLNRYFNVILQASVISMPATFCLSAMSNPEYRHRKFPECWMNKYKNV